MYRAENISSRIHSLNHFPKEGVSCYVKREDELGCGISGSKLRKYASLIPFFIQEKIAHLLIIAGPQSNNLLAALQVAREHQLQVTVFLLKPWTLELKGNFKLSRLFLHEEEIIWIERSDWHQVYDLAQKHVDRLKVKGYVLDEGASVPEAMPGAVTLADDVIVNEQQAGIQFQHIFVDAGTGFSAAALIYGLFKKNHPATIHVLLLADNEFVFQQKLKKWLGFLPQNYLCFYPSTAKAFGAINNTIKQEIKRVACEEGILVDPVYAAKLFYESRRIIAADKLAGNILIIHSGGTLTMPNFTYTP